jgi:hypothetical protein
VGLLRLLAGLLLLLWLLRAVRNLVAPPAKRQRPDPPRKKDKFSAENVEEAEYEELP